MGFLDRLMGKPLEKPAFAEAMAKGFAKQGVGVNSVDLQAFELVLDTKLRVNLGNVYGQYVAAGAADRDRIVEKFVSAALQKESIPARYEDARKGLMPVLRGAAGSSLLELQMRLNGVIDAAELGEVRWA
jgi:hypothetical protein